ncbi:hypothetical protein [Nonlabens ponticola]|uniref:Uncharacterized protein n=1 Tax=Nonlabens ponticola TaxID=2496866 RepID=A0A3S9MYH1_9FLAO|nr:hypothetical protein [Nonlabens ponticola]AZQ44164.1 hypothetical protein EJ995_07940 [Nonlabens ponticola]
MLLIVTGALFKILHWGFGENAFINGNVILATGLALKVMALIVFMGKLLKANKSETIDEK